MTEINLYSIQKHGGKSTPLKSEDKIKRLTLKFKTLLLQSQSKMLEAFNNPREFQGNFFPGLPPLLFGDHSLLDFLSRPQAPASKITGTPEYSLKKVYGQYQLEFAKVTQKRTTAGTPLHDFASLQNQASEAAKKHGIPGDWFQKLIHIESGFDPLARSPKGALGLGQLMPATAKELGLRVTSPDDNSEGSVWNPASNLDASARYLNWLQDIFLKKGINGSEAWNFTAAAYNAGIGNIQKVINMVENQDSLTWKEVAAELPAVTGNASKETLRYVKHLQV